MVVDLTDAPRKLLHARLSIPVKPGPLTLLYPKWIPGEHSPTGPIDNVAGIRLTAGSQALAWQRDDTNMYALHVQIPEGVETLDAALDFLATASPTGFSAGASTSSNLCILSWNTLLLYPSDADAFRLQFVPSVRLPADWKYGTALTPSHSEGALVSFQPVSLNTLVDSPLLAGRYFKELPLAPDIKPSHYLDLAGDGPEDLNINSDDLASINNLIREAAQLFGSHHYTSYHFLLSLSDSVAHFGLEHHQSSDDRVDARTLLDDDLRLLSADLLPHEFTHSWNGKYRRPSGLATGNFSDPMKGELLWVYEGLTQYLGNVLAVRCGLWSSAQYKAYLADSAAELDARPGRSWRNLSDTAVAAQILYETSDSWDNLRRSVDYYPEGELIWLDVDATVRRLSGGHKSIDDFCRRFYGPGGNAEPTVSPYQLADVLNALNAVQPYDWALFFRDRVTAITAHAPLGGLQQSGYQLIFNSESNEYGRANESRRHGLDAWYSLGFRAGSDSLTDVLFHSPAYQAGLGPGMKILAVNGRTYSDDLLQAALDDKKPVELIVENTGFVKTVTLAYSGGRKYPHLKRIDGVPDLLKEILKPLVARKAAPVTAN